jgi:hypothetical protein
MKMTKQESGHLGGTAFAKVAKEYALKRNSEKLEAYYKNPNVCKCCEKAIEAVFTKNGAFDISGTRKKVFCNHSCSASYNNSFVVKKEARKCGNPECDNFTKNKTFCCNGCQGKYARLQMIEKFLNGQLTDGSIRCKTVREYLIRKQDGGCAICKMPPIWNSKSMVFIVDHIDGNYENNSPENVRAICPNCNSQTDTFGSKNRKEHENKRPFPNPNRQR